MSARVDDLGYRIEIRTAALPGCVGRLIAYAAEDDNGRWHIHAADGEIVHTTSRAMAAADLSRHVGLDAEAGAR